MFHNRVVIIKKITLTLVLVHLMHAMPLLADNSKKQTDELVFGVLPFLSTELLFTRFTPLADYLSTKLGQPVRLETAKDFSTFLRRTSKEKRYDLVFTAPHFYYRAQREAGYRAIVRVARDLNAIIVVPNNSSIKQLSELKGGSLATTDPLALSTIVMRDYLVEAGIDPSIDVSTIAAPNHSASLLLAYKGITDAAVLMLPPFEMLSVEIQQSMRVIATSKKLPHVPVAVTATMDNQMADKIEKILLEMNDDEQGKLVMKSVMLPGFINVKPALYDGLKWAAEQLD